MNSIVGHISVEDFFLDLREDSNIVRKASNQLLCTAEYLGIGSTPNLV